MTGGDGPRGRMARAVGRLWRRGRDAASEQAVRPTLDELVDQAGMESFPASDPPSFWARDRDRSDAPRRRTA